MNIKKYMSITLMSFSSFIGFNLNSGAVREHLSRDLRLINKVIEADKQCKDRWLDFKLDHCSETIKFIKSHYNEALNRAQHYIDALARAGSQERSEKIAHELLESMLKHSEEHLKKAHELHQSLHKQAHHIYHEELRRFEELKKEVRHGRHEEREERHHKRRHQERVVEECEPVIVEECEPAITEERA